MIPDALICTVGTSMISHLSELRLLSPEKAAARIKRLVEPSRGGAEHETLQQLTRNPDLLDPGALCLLCSDTDDGEHVARILAEAYRGVFRRAPEWQRCKDLRDDQPKTFATRGLRSLTNDLISLVNGLRRQGHLPAIDATGGYKPQIAYAALAGQILQVPVYYRYAGFSEVMVLQPLPVSVDVQVWFDHLWFLERLREDMLPDREIPQNDKRLAALLMREDRLVTLSPLGELLAGAVDQLLARQGAELAPPPSEIPKGKKKVSYEDGNSGKHRGLEDFVGRLKAVEFVTYVVTFYFNPDLPKPSRVKIPSKGPEDCLEVWYGDGKALTKMQVGTTARNRRELLAAKMQLGLRLGLEDR